MARKSRKNPIVQEKPAHVGMKVWKAALYIRLSVEFNGRRGDSLETQQQIMEAYLALCPDIEIVAVYTDNGTTGRTFEREAFQRMLDDVERGRINCVVVKDLSRLGRNAIDSGYYIEKYFPPHQVRVIAVNDQFDSENKENSGSHLIVPLKNMINEAYAADISKKVKAQQRQAMQDGEFVGARPPFGYKKAPDNCHKLLVNEDTAPIVRQIFQWTVDGISLNEVVKRLNQSGYPTPGHYLAQTGLITNKRLMGSGKWQTWTVSKILADEVYMGDMVQGKSKTIGHKQVPTDRSEWIVVRGTHEPLIARELYERVQAVRERAAAKQGTEKIPYTENILRGRIFCGCCGKNLHRQRSRGIYSYRCIANDRMGVQYCPGGVTHLPEKRLFDALLAIIRKHAEVVVGTHAKLKQQDYKITAKKAEMTAEISKLQQETERNRVFLTSLYENFVTGILTGTEYHEMKADYTQKIETAVLRVQQLQSKQKALENQMERYTDIAKRLAAVSEDTALSALLVNQLIDCVTVNSAEDIHVKFKFESGFERLMEVLEDV